MDHVSRSHHHCEPLEYGFVGLAPSLEDRGDPIPVGPEFFVSEDRRLDLLGLHTGLAVTFSAVTLEQCVPQRREHAPVGFEVVDVPVGNAAVQVGVEVMEVLRFA